MATAQTPQRRLRRRFAAERILSLPEPPAPSPQSPAPSPGFTLLEVLAAIALLAIALAIGLGALGRSARNAAQGVALDTAVERAQSLLAEQGLTTPLKNGVQSGTFDDGMAWTLEIHVLPRTHPASAGAGAVPQPVGVVGAGTAGIDVYQLDVAVQYGDGRTLRLSTQRAQAASPAGNRE